MEQAIAVDFKKHTKRALFLSSLLHEPLFTLYSFVPFILYKDLGASPFQIALLMMLKPISTILSFYWSAWSKGRLQANVLGAGLLMRIPFLLVPWIGELWYVIVASVNYMLFYRAGMPAWLEILRKNIPAGEREKSFSWSSAWGYAEGVLLALAMGLLLDQKTDLWKQLFVGCSLLGIMGVLLQSRVPVLRDGEQVEKPASLNELVVRPWRDCWQLMRDRKDFAQFQWGFMACGFAIMLLQPAIPIYMADDLGFSHTQMAIAIAMVKGFGYVASSPIWARFMGNLPIHRLSSAVFFTMALFPILMGLAKWELLWFYAAYFVYGIGQGGSHLVWSLSGPHFAGKEESARYTGVNVVMAGLRGLVGPPLGGWITAGFGAVAAMGVCSLLCFFSGLGLHRSKQLAARED